MAATQEANAVERRQFTEAQKRSIIADYEDPTKGGPYVIKTHGVYSGQISNWRKQLAKPATQATGNTAVQPKKQAQSKATGKSQRPAPKQATGNQATVFRHQPASGNQQVLSAAAQMALAQGRKEIAEMEHLIVQLTLKNHRLSQEIETMRGALADQREGTWSAT